MASALPALAPARAMYHVFGADAARRIDTAVGFANIAGGDRGSFRNFAAATGLALRSGAAGMVTTSS